MGMNVHTWDFLWEMEFQLPHIVPAASVTQNAGMLQVPPMPAAEALAVLQAELLGQPLDEIFAWINLDTPLGSASIAQVGCLTAARQACMVHLTGDCFTQC